MKVPNGALSSLGAVGALALAVGLAFPREAFVFRAAECALPKGSAAIVFLDAAAESELLRSVRDTWRKGGASGRLYADLVFSDLPALPKCEVLPIEQRGQLPQLPVIEPGVGPYLPSQRAPAPVRLPTEPIVQQLPFSREELLRIN